MNQSMNVPVHPAPASPGIASARAHHAPPLAGFAAAAPGPRRVARLAVVAALAVLAGCTITPKQIDEQAVRDRVQADRARMYADQEPVRGPIDFPEALARALKYNLDHRQKLMETALAHGILDVGNKDMLPKLLVEAGYAHRNNDSGGTSIGIEDRVVSLRPSTSEERTHWYERATFTWNALDFGISYYRARQAADEVNIAEERRRKILQNIAADVRHAYWRALGAQRLLDQAVTLRTRIAQGLEKSREAERAGVMPPAQGLAYQRTLLDAMTLVTSRLQEMQFARRELAALMNLPPQADFTLVDGPMNLPAPQLLDIERLEDEALMNRPELREEDYRARIGAAEARRQVLTLFPNLAGLIGWRSDSNAYLYNRSWIDAGASLSFDLFRLAAIPAVKRANRARAGTDETRRMALSMAVLTQVRVAAERYRLAVQDREYAVESSRVDQRMARMSRSGAEQRLESDLEALRNEARALAGQFGEATAQASTQAALGRLLNSVGLNVLPDTVRSQDIASVAAAIRTQLDGVERRVAQEPAFVAAPARPVRIVIRDLPRGSDEPAVRAAVERILTRNGLHVAGDADAAQAVLFDMRFAMQREKSLHAASWTLSMQPPREPVATQSGTGITASGAPAAAASPAPAAPAAPRVQRYQSYLPEQPAAATMVSFAEAATLSALGDLLSTAAVRADAATPVPAVAAATPAVSQ